MYQQNISASRDLPEEIARDLQRRDRPQAQRHRINNSQAPSPASSEAVNLLYHMPRENKRKSESATTHTCTVHNYILLFFAHLHSRGHAFVQLERVYYPQQAPKRQREPLDDVRQRLRVFNTAAAQRAYFSHKLRCLKSEPPVSRIKQKLGERANGKIFPASSGISSG